MDSVLPLVAMGSTRMPLERPWEHKFPHKLISREQPAPRDAQRIKSDFLGLILVRIGVEISMIFMRFAIRFFVQSCASLHMSCSNLDIFGVI